MPIRKLILRVESNLYYREVVKLLSWIEDGIGVDNSDEQTIGIRKVMGNERRMPEGIELF